MACFSHAWRTPSTMAAKPSKIGKSATSGRIRRDERYDGWGVVEDAGP